MDLIAKLQPRDDSDKKDTLETKTKKMTEHFTMDKLFEPAVEIDNDPDRPPMRPQINENAIEVLQQVSRSFQERLAPKPPVCIVKREVPLVFHLVALGIIFGATALGYWYGLGVGSKKAIDELREIE